MFHVNFDSTSSACESIVSTCIQYKKYRFEFRTSLPSSNLLWRSSVLKTSLENTRHLEVRDIRLFLHYESLLERKCGPWNITRRSSTILLLKVHMFHCCHDLWFSIVRAKSCFACVFSKRNVASNFGPPIHPTILSSSILLREITRRWVTSVRWKRQLV